ncbi:hypothetical protein PR1_65 [Providencia phage vB_PreS_PR1]|uniref:Uncharacterized protein n=1 Tax=Providencia phage vB_PreS_PR1 TaxID=1931407 RepID=A0A1S6KV14_9CAUD|nr:hypothetical protein FDH30_gp150 [Providencia phage vB_PreS_PR1]AQT25254.1 hypothetical protein PR1_65 [Providencia phage vB_PreS_PR1]
MKFLLINAENNYADEFDLEGFILVKGEEAERALQLIKVFDKVPDQEINFGTNESVYLHHTSWELKELSELEYNVILSTLGEQYGLLNVDYLLDAIEEGSLFKKERDAFNTAMQNLKEVFKPFNADYWKFVKFVESMPSFTQDGVYFDKISRYNQNFFRVTKEINGEEHYMEFVLEDCIEYHQY